MWRFLKDNSNTIVKMIVNQIGMLMFGIVLSLATSQNDVLMLCASIFSVCFYMVLLYTMSWDCGSNEKIKIDSHRLSYMPLKGLFMSLYANTLNILLGIAAIVGYYGASGYTIPDASKVRIPEWGASLLGSVRYPSSPDWAAQLFSTAKQIALFIESMYDGIIASFFAFSPFIYLLIVIPSLVVCTLGYYLGVKDKRIFGFVSGGKQ